VSCLGAGALNGVLHRLAAEVYDREAARVALGTKILRPGTIRVGDAVELGDARGRGGADPRSIHDRLRSLLAIVSLSGRDGNRSALGAAVRLRLADFAEGAEAERLRTDAARALAALGIADAERVMRYWGLDATST